MFIRLKNVNIVGLKKLEKLVSALHENVKFAKLDLKDGLRKSAETPQTISSSQIEGDSDSVIKFGRMIPSSESNLENNDYIYIGQEGKTLNNFIMSFNKSTFHSYDPVKRHLRKETLNVNRSLAKRFYLIEKAKDAKLVGIIAGTLSTAKYLPMLNRLKAVIKSAGKRSYSFIVGKLNVPKLANFMEIDVFVMVACPENSLIDSSEFYKPVLTPYEMEMACNYERKWEGKCVTDYQELLPGGSAYVEIPESQDAVYDVSLITGAIRVLGKVEEGGSGDSTALIERPDGTIVATESGTAAEYLANRSWRGVEQKLGETPVVKAVKGRSGIASEYKDELPS